MTEHITLRELESQDAPAMQELAEDTGVLEVNGTYYYSLMGRHFSNSGIIAEDDSGVCGYITGYRLEDQPNTLFVWQVGVATSHQGRGLGKEMLLELIERTRPTHVHATITPDNKASIGLFRSIAKHLGAESNFSKRPFLTSEDLGPDEKVEHLMKIGPIF